MKERVGEVFSIAKDNRPVMGCTISKTVQNGRSAVTYFSLAADTDISAEIHPYHKLILVAEGDLEVYGTDGFSKKLSAGDGILTYADRAVGMQTQSGTVYTEISIQKEDVMNNSYHFRIGFQQFANHCPEDTPLGRDSFLWYIEESKRLHTNALSMMPVPEFPKHGSKRGGYPLCRVLPAHAQPRRVETSGYRQAADGCARGPRAAGQDAGNL